MTISKDLSAPLVAVVGATGNQGGSVIKALSESDKPYRIRGFTRNTGKAAAQALTAQGVEMVAVSLTTDNRDEVFTVFQGATYAFAVTNFWEHVSKQQEIDDGKLFVDAAKAAGVKLFIWSGLSNTAKVSGGKYTLVDHFDGKAEVTAYGRASGIGFVNVEAGLYMDNFTTFMAPRKQEDGSFVLYVPAPASSTAPLLDTAHDYGLFVRKAIESLKEQDVYAHSENISYADIAKQLGEVTGKKITFVETTQEQYIDAVVASGSFSPRIAKELYEMYAYIAEFGYFGTKDTDSSRVGLARAPRTWAEYAKATDWSKILN